MSHTKVLLNNKRSFPCRKKTIIGNTLFLTVGGVIILTSKFANSFEMIVVARFLMGAGAGKGGRMDSV